MKAFAATNYISHISLGSSSPPSPANRIDNVSHFTACGLRVGIDPEVYLGET